MLSLEAATDHELLESTRRSSAAFGEFYRRHERRVLGYLLRRTGSGELAADLCAEVFAAALESRLRNGATPQVPVAWLFGIANHKLADSMRRSRVEDGARRALQMRTVALTRGRLSEIERLWDEAEATTLLEGLALEQREALVAHVLDERAYAEIAAELRCSESVVRKRVSRGLAALRLRASEGADAAA